MNVKAFSMRLNQELDGAGFPSEPRARAKAFAKVFNLQTHRALNIISGQLPPSTELLEQIAHEFELSVDALLDNTRGVI